jgi:hypothetical protein
MPCTRETDGYVPRVCTELRRTKRLQDEKDLRHRISLRTSGASALGSTQFDDGTVGAKTVGAHTIAVLAPFVCLRRQWCEIDASAMNARAPTGV